MAGWGWGQAGLARNPRYRSLGGALKATKPGRNPYAFTPYQPPPLPTGSYDPGLDAQAGAANRGYFYGSQDYETGQGRRNVDYGLQSGYAAQDHQAALDSLKFGLGRTQQDLATQAQRGGQDYMRNIQMLTRNYQRLGTSQLQQQNATGALHSGAVQQAQAKRTANEAFDRAPIDQGYDRFKADNAQAGQRAVQDAFIQTANANTQYGRQQGDLALNYERGSQDASTIQGRAGYENTQYGLDVEKAKQAQAAQSGYVAPAMPGNEHIGANGQHTRTITKGNYILTVDPSGKVLSRKRRS
jgi:hypothetical protein